MLKHERQAMELELIKKNQVMSVRSLEDALGVSGMTIRRDLEELTAGNLIKRIYGGVTSIDFDISQSSSFKDNQMLHFDEKSAIAAKAASTIEPGDFIYLGPGTTNELIVDYLPTTDIQVVTSNIAAFNKMTTMPNSPTLILVGGLYDAKSDSVNGNLAERMLQPMQFDKSFISVRGIDQLSLTTFNSNAAELQGLALSNSRERYIISDLFKMGQRAFFEFYQMKPDDHLITNSQLDEHFIDFYSKNVKLILA
ncbi:DeoR/GlpR family DNA-binding transcription regulator [Lacticaseibacillus daqingensis]|uniref:DeoR/GlpR family DNA-binding transcription regulator n=1 Tax=Lacticaseibacillus daqingensis TaxID=2486014 RepID=UPI0013DE0255|nr:DeoR/GlpR family DNA-binding transcription regulator [Lacticaseibacillus daqingensis]